GQLARLRPATHVSRMREGPHPVGRRHLGCGRSAARRIAADHDHVGAGPGQSLDDATTDAATAARDQRSAPGQVEHQTPSDRPMISFMISVVPPKIVSTRVSTYARAIGYSSM